ncbi:class I SAM-dependent methyltransferase [Bacillus vallismortis]|uniref:Class I SAM-dependent methyltransferase n=1 Tax=Bacillus vallismortis TaxID=72361 RepID=A0AAP3CGG2_BACVA|nr:class I SAM-dependent methyltransferase [Bacillus vallismortis]MBG9771310.1 SAM-dependent methlyltransferase [Bacillus vallismortis]MCI3985742.1 class I SAM-dependent methyltransferase [Bacillus vallismortis]MCY7918657.1 class I SAM-dependent methyltransferase [Bacillus vallismortis]MCY8309170.1 class I SAM-dependent methyltransferase [Bacillus vallismortis]MCY8315869.1 class I SAM-dependent methyltransferase [Bacillus vallismortis]
MMNMLSKTFSKPKGIFGMIAGYIMAAENQTLNQWTIDQLGVTRGDSILEVGFGPGYCMQQMLKREKDIRLDGIDVSETMMKLAARSVKSKGVRLMQGNIETFPLTDSFYDKVISVNNYTIWNDQTKGVKQIYRALKPGGKAAITMQPREADASPEKTKSFGKQMIADFKAAGFEDIDIQFKNIKPELSVCATAKKPAT